MNRTTAPSVVHEILLLATLLIVGFVAPPNANAEITPEQARDLVISKVIAPDPRAPQMVGFFYGQSTPSMQILFPGQTVRDLDATIVFPIGEPSYFFWIDTDPGLEWLHEALFALVGAKTGELTVGSGQSWPVVSEMEFVDFNRLRNESPDLFYGEYPPATGPVFSFAPAPQAPSQQWAIIAVGRNLDGADEKMARKNDIARIQDYLNKNDGGPMLPAENITTLTGSDTTGTTVEAVCDAIDALQGQGCEKVWFFYTGHGGNAEGGYCVLQDPNADETDRLTFEQLACKLLDLGDVEICAVMTCCYSGKAVEKLQKKTVKRDGKKVGLKGTILTSGGNNPTKREPDGSGSVFWKAVDACANDPLSDYDGDGHVTLLEALAWARDQNPALAEDGPRGEGLGDKREVKFSDVQTVWTYSRSLDGAGTLDFTAEKHSYRIKKGSSAGRDTTICRVNIYVKNPSGSPHVARQSIKIKFYDKRGQLIGEETFRARLKAGEKVCLFQMPEGTTEITPEGVAGRSGLLAERTGAGTRSRPSPGSAMWPAIGAAGTSVLDHRAAEFTPGEIIFDFVDFAATAGSGYVSDVTPVPGYPLATIPPAWVAPTWAPDQLVFLCGAMPTASPEGAEIEWWVTDGSDSTKVGMNARLFVEDAWPCNVDRQFQHDAVSSPLVDVCNGSVLHLLNSCLQLSSAGELTVDGTSTLRMDWSAVQSDSAVSYAVAASGILALDHADFIEPDLVTLNGVSGSIYHLAVFESAGSGLRFAGNLSGLSANFILVDGTVGDGLVLDGTSACTLRSVTVEDAGGFDVVVRGGADATLVDASIDDGNVLVTDAGSELRKSWSTGIVVSGGDELPLEDVGVTITDAAGNVVLTGTTDGEGVVDLPDLLQYVQTESGRELRTPHTVELTFADVDTAFSWSADRPDLIIVDWFGATSHVPGDPQGTPDQTGIVGLAPNPFRNGTLVRYELTSMGLIELDVFDPGGRHVRRLAREERPAGSGTVVWDGTDREGRAVGSGIYFVRLRVGGDTSWSRGVLLR